MIDPDVKIDFEDLDDSLSEDSISEDEQDCKKSSSEESKTAEMITLMTSSQK